MKKTKNLIIFVLFALVLSLSSCEPVGLPDITETGENTFGMKVDGKNWLPRDGFISLPNFYVYYDSCCALSIKVYNAKESLSFFIPNIFCTGDYLFACGREHTDMSESDSSNNFYCWTSFLKDSVAYYPEREYVLYDKEESNIHITKLDTIKKIVSGTFSVNLYNNKGEKLEITDGRFDAHYKLIDYTYFKIKI